MRCGADTGGTFTDIVTDDGRIAKVLSTSDDPSRAVAVGLSPLSAGGARTRLLAHGTTVATNAPLVPRELRFEVGGRLDAGGAEIAGLDPRAVPVLPPGVWPTRSR